MDQTFKSFLFKRDSPSFVLYAAPIDNDSQTPG